MLLSITPTHWECAAKFKKPPPLQSQLLPVPEPSRAGKWWGFYSFHCNYWPVFLFHCLHVNTYSTHCRWNKSFFMIFTTSVSGRQKPCLQRCCITQVFIPLINSGFFFVWLFVYLCMGGQEVARIGPKQRRQENRSLSALLCLSDDRKQDLKWMLMFFRVC